MGGIVSRAFSIKPVEFTLVSTYASTVNDSFSFWPVTVTEKFSNPGMGNNASSKSGNSLGLFLTSFSR